MLAGVSTPRQWSAAMPIAEVIRAATAEVEEYRRVTMRRIDDAQLAGSVLTNVAHMLAELIENGLALLTTGLHCGDRGAQGYLIAIIDRASE